MASNQYTFLPWIRKGVSTVLKYTELDAHTGNSGPRVGFSATANFANSINSAIVTGERQMSMISPGDVKGISEAEIFRIDPQPFSNNLESNYLPLVEFYSEDLPWRYTPLAAHDGGKKLRP